MGEGVVITVLASNIFKIGTKVQLNEDGLENYGIKYRNTDFFIIGILESEKDFTKYQLRTMTNKIFEFIPFGYELKIV